MTAPMTPNPGRRHAEFLCASDLSALGFAALGKNVLIHSTCVIVDSRNISIGSNVRIDAFSVLSGDDLNIGSHVHIAAHCMFAGAEPIIIGDFAGISHGTKVLSSSDDFHGGYLTGPTVTHEFTNVISAPVEFGRHSVTGANCVVLPGSLVGEGAMVGALSLVRGSLAAWTVNVGCPTRRIGERDRSGVLEMESKFVASLQSPNSTTCTVEGFQ
jgi:acetyltransferase-like isoleucine patch superfamily enzyme